MLVTICESCSETTLTGKSQFHINTPPEDWTSNPHDGKQRTSETVCECSEIAALHRAPPQQPTMSVVKPEGGPAASVKPGQESCVRSSGIITLSARRSSDSYGRSLPQTRPQWSITSGSPMKFRFHISIPWGLNPCPSWREEKGWPTGPVRLCVIAVRLQALHSLAICETCKQTKS
jgi:hypothetical protein